MGMTWQCKAIDVRATEDDLMNLGDWEPFAVDNTMSHLLLRREVFVETDEPKSSVHAEG